MKKHIVQLKNWILILVALLSFGGLSKDVKAASGNVYSCQIARTYEHPVTGKVLEEVHRKQLGREWSKEQYHPKDY